jgi:hypothetical protein
MSPARWLLRVARAGSRDQSRPARRIRHFGAVAAMIGLSRSRRVRRASIPTLQRGGRIESNESLPEEILTAPKFGEAKLAPCVMM